MTGKTEYTVRFQLDDQSENEVCAEQGNADSHHGSDLKQQLRVNDRREDRGVRDKCIVHHSEQRVWNAEKSRLGCVDYILACGIIHAAYTRDKR